jgi:copper chaperone CopZ
MYGDHHVIEVRRVLLELPGVEGVYASSAFHTVEVQYDPAKINPSQIESILEAAGYLGELQVSEESGALAVQPEGQEVFMRHTAAFATTKDTISFAQQVPFSGRPLWPCPGMGILKNGGKELSNG